MTNNGIKWGSDAPNSFGFSWTDPGNTNTNPSPQSFSKGFGSAPQNPWLGINPGNELSWWNRFTDSLGFTNHQGRLQNQYDLAAAQWQSEYDLAMADRQYNTPAEQVERMRAAGLNPDLNGGQNISPGESELANNKANQKTIEPIRELDSAMSVFGKAMQFAASFLQGGVGIALDTVSTLADFHSKDMSTMDSVLGSIKNELVNDYVGRINTSDRKDAFLKATGKEQQDILNEFLFNEDGEDNEYEGIKYRTSTAFKTRRAQKYAEQRLHEYVRNDRFRQDVESRLGSNAEERMATAKAVGAVEALSSTGDDLFDAMQIVAESYYKEWKKLSRLNQKHYDNQYNVELSLSPQAQAAGINAGYWNTSLEYRKNTIGSSFQTEVMGKLLNAYKNGNKAAGALLFGYQTMSSQAGLIGTLGSAALRKAPVINKIYPRIY